MFGELVPLVEPKSFEEITRRARERRSRWTAMGEAVQLEVSKEAARRIRAETDPVARYIRETRQERERRARAVRQRLIREAMSIKRKADRAEAAKREKIEAALKAEMEQRTAHIAKLQTEREHSVRRAWDIIRWVARRYRFRPEDMLGGRRGPMLIKARHLAIQIVAHSRFCAALSLPDIGKIFMKDHTSILNAARKAPSYPKRYRRAFP